MFFLFSVKNNKNTYEQCDYLNLQEKTTFFSVFPDMLEKTYFLYSLFLNRIIHRFFNGVQVSTASGASCEIGYDRYILRYQYPV